MQTFTNSTRMLSRTLRVSTRAIKPVRYFSTIRPLAKQVNLDQKTATKLSEVTGPDGSLIGPGAKEGTIPSDLDQATGLERFEILGKMEGIDVFDMEDPIVEGKGTMQDPYMVPSYIGERLVGCRGKNGEEHKPYWMKVEDGKYGRCWHCGTVYALKYLGEPGHGHH